MDRKIILGVTALAVFSITLILQAPDNSEHTPDTLPWNITHPTPETTRVLGITLGQSTLKDAEKIFKHEAELEISLFKPTDGKLGVEAFTDEVNFNGLKAKIVMNIGVPADELQGMYQRGLRINNTPSGKRITLTFDDLERVKSVPIASLTYLPTVSLEQSVIAKRFGNPAQRILEKDTGLEHWLYPENGLDVVTGAKQKPLLQYLPPKDFDLLRAPLLSKGEVLN
jgi:hypothetical protein